MHAQHVKNVFDDSLIDFFGCTADFSGIGSNSAPFSFDCGGATVARFIPGGNVIRIGSEYVK
jgi:hypothetical protein